MIEATQAKIVLIDAKLAEVGNKSEACRRLLAIPGIGPVAAGTLLALSGDMKRFRTGRDYAAWLGLTPRQNSSGERVRIGRMSKAGNRDLRTLLVLGDHEDLWGARDDRVVGC
jgi:transposase